MADNEPTPDQTRAREALRTWKTRNDDRDRLVWAAEHAGVTRAEIQQDSGLNPKTIRAILDNTEPKEGHMSTVTTTDDRLSGLHHPNFVRDLGEDEAPRFMFRPFTGTEDPPYDLMPAPAELDGRELVALRDEYLAAEHEWKVARFEAAARPVLEAAQPVYRRYRDCLEDMNTAATALFTATTDNMWRVGAANLYDHQQAAAEAAEQWDEQANILVGLEAIERAKFAFPADAPELDEVAARIGIDIMRWSNVIQRTDVSNPRTGPTATVKAVQALVDAQTRKLRAVVAMTSSTDEAAPVTLTGSELLHRAMEIMLGYQATGTSSEDRAGYLSMTNGDERAHAVVRLYASLDAQWRTKADADEVATVAAARAHATMMVEAFRARHH